MKYIWDNERQEFVADQRDRMHHHYVMNDLEFRSTDGAMIGSRSTWREHLKRTGTIELGHSDIQSQKDSWESRKSSHRERMKQADKFNVRPTDAPPVSHETQYERSLLNREIANRLDGRPTPGRKELLKLTLDLARNLRH